ncbi:molybdenum cofactor sulfurase 3 isoform X2 [Osmia bicornis bicornis]|uniref:molybdenum cofactor sulfurase 3 isoform X2 n=1 Tax=Osmia bicornis bicornis TaxID=1437191 RepID=UPI0010F95E6F|nr:molybdenum cofactor sulfurase 3 isoform X2 [Osmia bicornis bicornis]
MEGMTTAPYAPVYDQQIVKRFENEFSRIKGECYLDHAGATLYSDTQIKNVAADLNHSLYANPHSIGSASNVTQDIIERIRYLILDHFHTSSEEYSVIFTSGATDSLKIIADTFLFHKDQTTNVLSSPGHFVYTQDNHTSVLGMREVVVKKGVKITCLNHDNAFEILNYPLKSLSSCSQQDSNSLFVYPAQCNFSGLKYPLRWIKDVHRGVLSNIVDDISTKWYVLLDAASFVSTNDLDLSTFKPDFVSLSFYKMFGYPTGIGALLVKNSSTDVLQKVYYGGGTVEISLSSEMFHVKRQNLHQRFEDGTVSFLSIISLRHGFDILSSISMEKISKHVFILAKFLYKSLLMLHHRNGQPVVKLYSDTVYEDCNLQGGIIAFNLRRSSGEYVGYMEVLNMAALFKIHLRTGCFCNPGACQRHLGLSSEEVLQNYDSGYICGGGTDLINGRPTGAVRISFGYMSTIKDAQTLLHMIEECFVDKPRLNKMPVWWTDYKKTLDKKYYHHNANMDDISDNIKSSTNGIIDKLQNIKESVSHFINDNQFFKLMTPTNATKKECILEQLYIYPIKSCAAYKITGSWNLNSKGLQYDRKWMIVSSSGTCLTQKQHINLCLLKPIILQEKGIMQLNYPGISAIDVPLHNDSIQTVEETMCQSRVCGHKVEGLDCGSNVSEWLSLALGLPNLRLIRQSDCDSNKKGNNKPELSFSSQAQYLLINKASVLWLSDKVSGKEVQKDTIIHRFRGNIILSDCEPFEETHWKHMYIGKNSFAVTGPCTRCQMICIDQTTGVKTIEPLRTLAEQFHGKLSFGIYLIKQTKEDGIISVGDIVHIS